jgi:hypothetical protein
VVTFADAAQPRMSIDTMSSKMDERLPTTFSKTISEAFEPYLSLWVDAQERYVFELRSRDLY